MIAKFGLAVGLALQLGLALAQTQPPKPAPKPAAKAAAYPATPAGAGYRFGPAPAWVRPLPAATDASAAVKFAAPGAKARRDPLLDIQTQLAPRSATATWIHLQQVALDSSTLREVSEPQINFNPAYQQLVIHQVGIVRNGQREDRLKDARIELMRREQMLERQMIDGVRTALVVLRDVRVGDVVDVAYTLEGENPIFDASRSDHVLNSRIVPVVCVQIRKSWAS